MNNILQLQSVASLINMHAIYTVIILCVFTYMSISCMLIGLFDPCKTYQITRHWVNHGTSTT